MEDTWSAWLMRILRPPVGPPLAGSMRHGGLGLGSGKRPSASCGQLALASLRAHSGARPTLHSPPAPGREALTQTRCPGPSGSPVSVRSRGPMGTEVAVETSGKISLPFPWLFLPPSGLPRVKTPNTTCMLFFFKLTHFITVYTYIHTRATHTRV